MNKTAHTFKWFIYGLQLAWWEWAQRSMHPGHPDSGEVTLKVAELKEKMKNSLNIANS